MPLRWSILAKASWAMQQNLREMAILQHTHASGHRVKTFALRGGGGGGGDVRYMQPLKARTALPDGDVPDWDT